MAKNIFFLKMTSRVFSGIKNYIKGHRTRFFSSSYLQDFKLLRRATLVENIAKCNEPFDFAFLVQFLETDLYFQENENLFKWYQLNDNFILIL